MQCERVESNVMGTITSATNNNIGLWDATTYLTDGTNTYALPDNQAVGMGVNGAPIFPVWNNKKEQRVIFCVFVANIVIITKPPTY